MKTTHQRLHGAAPSPGQVLCEGGATPCQISKFKLRFRHQLHHVTTFSSASHAGGPLDERRDYTCRLRRCARCYKTQKTLKPKRFGLWAGPPGQPGTQATCMRTPWQSSLFPTAPRTPSRFASPTTTGPRGQKAQVRTAPR